MSRPLHPTVVETAPGKIRSCFDGSRRNPISTHSRVPSRGRSTSCARSIDGRTEGAGRLTGDPASRLPRSTESANRRLRWCWKVICDDGSHSLGARNMNRSSDDPVDLLKVVRWRWPMIALITLGVVVVVTAYVQTLPTLYQAQAIVSIVPRSNASFFPGADYIS